MIGHILKNKEGEKLVINNQQAMDLIFACRELGYVDKEYKITEKFIEDIESDKVELPVEFKDFKEPLITLMQSIYTTANFKAADDENGINIKEMVLKPNSNFSLKEFQDLWNTIKVKTVYEVDFNSNELIDKAIKAIDAKLEVKKVLVTITEGEQKEQIDEASLKAGESMIKKKNKAERTESLLGSLKYDLIAEIAKETKLTRKTLVKILQGIKRLTFANFSVNPESFIKEISKLINSEKAATLIDNIIYSKLDKVYEDEIFTINNFKGSLKENILQVKKHIYDYVKTGSKIERTFAGDLESGQVLVYAKLPYGFKIPTPVGNYNPDWAIVLDTNEFKYVYFIAETKGSMESLQLKDMEAKKINYAKKHFEALGNSKIKYDVISTYKELRDKVMQ